MARFRSPALTLGQQIYSMERHFPSFFYKRVNNIPTWNGVLQPTSNSKVYRVKIVYRYNNQYSKAPKVWIISPVIQRAKHRYKDNSLCLYDPKDGNWTPYMPIAETIVPWAALWLLFHEIWLETDHWYGPEAPHTGTK